MASIKRIGVDKDGVPVWQAQYRRTPNGKNIHRRFHCSTRQEAERLVALDTGKADISLKWSEGLRIYLDAKTREGRQSGHLDNVARAAQVFIRIMGDIPIEKTTAELMKSFMQSVVRQPVRHPASGKVMRESGPKVANNHRKELLTIARYLLRHTDKISEIPFKNVPSLPVIKKARTPVARGKVVEYLEALPPHIRRPVMLVLFYGLRSTAVCNIRVEDAAGGFVKAIDKGGNQWNIPVDDMLQKIIDEAAAHRLETGTASDRLLVNARGRAWERTTLLKAAQRSWEAAGLERKKIHEIRHTLGTLAGKSFTPLMVQAAMRHKSRRSADAYSHPDEDMAAEVRQKIVSELFQFPGFGGDFGGFPVIETHGKEGVFACPCCGSNVLIVKEKGRNSN